MYVCLVLSLAIEKTQKYKVSQKFFSVLKYFWDIMYFPWEILPVPTYITSFHIYFTDTAFCRSDCYGNVNGVLLDSSRFPRFIQALARVSLHIPRACPRDMQGYEG